MKDTNNIEEIKKEHERLMKEFERVFEESNLDEDLTNEKNQPKKNYSKKIISKEEKINKIIEKELVNKSKEKLVKDIRIELATLYITEAEFPSFEGVFDDNIKFLRELLRTLGVNLED